jgi:tetratricopeptide (TPR) repeat protein
LHDAGRPERATALAREALALAEAAADRRAQAQAHNMLGVLARNAGEPQPALVQLERSLALAEELRDEPAQAAALNNLAPATATARRRSRTTSPICITPPGTTTMPWST